MKYFSILIILFSISACSDEKIKPSINPSLKIQEIPAQESWDAEIFFTDSGKTKAVLNAGHLRMFENARETLLDDNIKVDFYNDLEKKTTTLTAKRGKVDDATKNLWAIDDVVAVNDSGVSLKTEELMWRNSDQRIISDKFVTILTPKEKIEGYGFESDQHLRNYVIYNITYVTRSDSI